MGPKCEKILKILKIATKQELKIGLNSLNRAFPLALNGLIQPWASYKALYGLVSLIWPWRPCKPYMGLVSLIWPCKPYMAYKALYSPLIRPYIAPYGPL